jgi:hypothetical protein
MGQRRASASFFGIAKSLHLPKTWLCSILTSLRNWSQWDRVSGEHGDNAIIVNGLAVIGDFAGFQRAGLATNRAVGDD